MEKSVIYVDVEWSERNFACAWYSEECGAVIATAKTLALLKENFNSALKSHIACCVEDGDELPAYLLEGAYQVHYNLDCTALLRVAESFTTLKAISEVTGIHQKQLSHYATGLKRPRNSQAERIKLGLRQIAESLGSLV